MAGHRLEFVASRTEDAGVRVSQVGFGGMVFIRPTLLAP
jgi:hypothetical protein